MRRLNVSGVLRILGVSRSGYNSFKEREFNMSAKLSRKDELKSLILDIHLRSKQIYGAPKITMELKKQGIGIAEKTVGNYMREMGLRALGFFPGVSDFLCKWVFPLISGYTTFGSYPPGG